MTLAKGATSAFLLFITAWAAPGIDSNLPTNWTSQGCWTDNTDGRALTGASFANPNNTQSACIDFCSSYNYNVAGVEYSDECYCGNYFVNPSTNASSSDCSMTCANATDLACGGPNRLNVFWNGEQPPPPPTTNPGIDGWGSQGCYTDNPGARSLGKSADVPGGPNNMTVAGCVAACYDAGYLYSGVEYSTQCFCGQAIQNNAGPADTGCTMTCSGNSSEFCGGPNRINLYKYGAPPSTMSSSTIVLPFTSSTASSSTTTTTATTTTTEQTASSTLTTTTTTTTAAASQPTISQAPLSCPGSNGTLWTAPSGNNFLIECGIDHQAGDMGAQNVNSYEECIIACDSTKGCLDVSLSGVACYMKSTLGQAIANSGILGAKLVGRASPIIQPTTTTSTTTSNTSTSTTTTQTSSSVTSSSTSVTTTSTSVTSTTTTTTASSVPSNAPLNCPSSNGTIWYAASGKRFLIECGIDHQGGDLQEVNVNSYEQCIQACDDTPKCVDVSLSGVACYMKSVLGAAVSNGGILGAKLVASDFTLPSSSTTTMSSTTSVSTSSASLSTSSSTATTTSAAQTGMPTGYVYKGCWADNVNAARVLQFQQPDNANMTQESCTTLCQQQGYVIAGMEYSTQCFCGNQIIQGGHLAAADSDCNMACGGASSEKCGGPDRLTVYSNQTNITVLQPPAVMNSTGNWTYAGCYTDGPAGNGNRAFSKQIILSDNTPSNCLAKCAAYGYMTGGMEYADECYCGDWSDLTDNHETLQPDSQCNMACSGNGSLICGGQNHLSVYTWTGPPLYEFSYPTGAAAGSYEFLVPGLIVPLIAMASKNGKITFVEKHGTSYYGNSTGSFELDPSLVGGSDWRSAWRELGGIQTDVFCSAGLILPDKGARQINIGGWSGTSTYGIRFFTPNGELGTNSTSQWEENANEVALQAGRWYPSAMMMSNGSILVVGGEDGSNGAPVPSLELLPRAGGTVYCEWLELTDPNNLYPYLAVLPSGGIFTAYYNQSRILDPITLGTQSVLPDIPGSVDRIGGRTYPLEGTAVLMPQYAPYSDPLTVMICGGSPGVASDAIDNCVSISPEAPNANWTVERMPSQRVMSCIAALPDGTYLILNGAHEGVAGFGLGSDPNMNAVLYDPTKAVGARMSVMANTTIARLYHSEASLMDDGRVLVSGSDPEDNVHPEEMRIEVFNPPYILSGAPRPTFSISQTDWAYGGTYTFEVTSTGSADLRVSLMGAVASTHGNSMGQRTIFPAASCSVSTCTVTAPPNANVCPPGWFQMFVLDGPTPSHATWIRIGGDPGSLGEWPSFADFTRPGS